MPTPRIIAAQRRNILDPRGQCRTPRTAPARPRPEKVRLPAQYFLQPPPPQHRIDVSRIAIPKSESRELVKMGANETLPAAGASPPVDSQEAVRPHSPTAERTSRPARPGGSTEAISDRALARSGLTDLGWLRGVAILIPEVRGDLVGRIRIEYSGGLPHRCWMLMVAFSFAASVAPTGVIEADLGLRASVPAPWVDRRAQEPRTRCVRCAPPVRARNQSEMHSVSRSDAHLSTGRLRAGPGNLSSK